MDLYDEDDANVVHVDERENHRHEGNNNDRRSSLFYEMFPHKNNFISKYTNTNKSTNTQL